MKIAVLIPAYKPNDALVSFVQGLSRHPFHKVIVVDDGSGARHAPIFEAIRTIPNTQVLGHDINRGKGAALKTGFAHVHSNLMDCDAVITADADGQHLEEDILSVAQALEQNPNRVVLGARTFSGEVPLRSKVGNNLTRLLFKFFFRLNISDTQTGLRGIPRTTLPAFLQIPYNRYEYESEMLLVTSREGVVISEVPITTVYENNNASSHFNPLMDSLKIYFVLLRFTLASIASAFVDFVVFVLVYPLVGSILISIFAARAVSLCVNYTLVSRAVFYDESRVHRTFPKYLLLVILSGFLATWLIYLGHTYLYLEIYLAKILAESMLYILNFFVQKRFIFTAQDK